MVNKIEEQTTEQDVISYIEEHWVQAEEEGWGGTKWVNMLNLPVIDAKTPLTVHLTPTNIKHAIANSHSECGYANACRDLKGVLFAWVTKTMAYLIYEDKVVRYWLPMAMQKEVVVNDRSPSTLDPGMYEMRPPYPTRYARPPRPEKTRAARAAKSTGKKRPRHTTKARVTRVKQ